MKLAEAMKEKMLLSFELFPPEDRERHGKSSGHD